MKIIQLTAENIKRIKAVRITPEGSLVQITGRNAQGKTSVLDSIEMALGGKSTECPEVVRKDESSASVILDLDDIVVKKTWNKRGNSTLVVESKDGARFTSPQTMLNDLVGQLSFDPLDFMRQKPAEQVETLKAVCGLDFSELNLKKHEAYDARRDINRDIKQLETQLYSIDDDFSGVADEPIDISKLRAEVNNAFESKQEISGFRAEISHTQDFINRDEESIETYKRKIKECEFRIQKNRQSIMSMKAKIKEIPDPDVSALEAKIEESEAMNERVRLKFQRDDLNRELKATRMRSSELTEKIAEIDRTKAKSIAEAKMPISNLSFSDDGVIYQGQPLEQASQAEQIRVSAAIGITLNPKLRILLIRDGSLLDNDSLALLGKLAEDSDTQIWLERVSHGDGVGVVIEDGEVQA